MLGRELTRLLASRDDAETTALGSRDCDITDRAAVDSLIMRIRPEVIINCAAYTAVDAAEDAPRAADTLNHLAPAYIAAATRKAGALLIHVSTDYVFDGRATTPYTEGDPTAPLGVYGTTKLLGEKAVMESGCRYAIVRTQWLYSSIGKNFMLTMLRLFETKQGIAVVNDQTGSPTYAADLANALTSIALGFAEGQEGVYHFSNAGSCTWYDFAISIAALHATPCEIRPIATADYPTKATRPRYSVLSKEKISATFGISVPHWRDGLKRCFEALTADSQ